MAYQRTSSIRSAAPYAFTPLPDQWVNPSHITVVANNTPVSGTAYLQPVDIGPGALAAKGLGVNVATAAVAGPATVTVSLGIYAAATDGNPDLTQLLGSGTVDPTATGIKYLAFGSPITLAPPRYWTALLYVATGTPTQAPVFYCTSTSLTLPTLVNTTPPGTTTKAYAVTSLAALPTTVQTLTGHTGSLAPVVSIRAN